MIVAKIFRCGRLGLFLLLAFLLVACGSRTREGCEPENRTQGYNSGPQVPDPMASHTPQDPEEIRTLWHNSPHANTFILSEDNTNSSCAQCHAPLNWSPTKADIPVSWVEKQLNPAPSSLHISEEAWTHVDCKVCHSSEENQIDGEFAWLEIAPLETYVEMETTTQLCQKCHLETAYDLHQPLLLKGSHADFICTDCHDPHSTTTNCSTSACHEPFAEECERIETHDKPHSEVTCVACHDGDESEIAWNEQRQAWDTVRTSATNHPQEYEPYVSHNIVLAVDCDRCHAPGDHPWDPQ